MIAVWTVEIPQWGNATLLEILWLLSGVLAVLVCGRHIPYLTDDYMLALARTHDRPQLRVAARANLRREVLRLIIGAIIAVLGTYSAIQAPIIPGPAMVSFVGLLLTAGLLAISFSTVAMSMWDWHDRQVIQGLIALGYNGSRSEGGKD